MSSHRSFPLPGDQPLERPDLPWSLTHLALDVRLDLDARSVDGSATWTCAPRRAAPGPLVLDAFALEVRSVTHDGGSAATFHNDGRHLEIDLPPEARSVRVDYSARPVRGLHFIAPDEAYPDRPRQVWSQGQDEDHHHWIPCVDHPAVRFTQELSITVPDGLAVLSNGHAVGSDDAGGGWTTHRWRFDVPHVTYLLTVVAGELTRVELSGGPEGVDLYALGAPGDEERLAHNLGQTGAMMRFFEEFLDTPYPYEQYAQVCVGEFTFGGMENTTATTLTDRTLHPPELEDDYSSEPLVAHELAHQWFGDLVSCRDWPHAWLHEGFATYFDQLWCERSKGADEFAWAMKEEADGYFDEDRRRYRRPIVTHTRNAPIDIFDAHLYNKGAWVVHMLRTHLGDEALRKGLSDYLRTHGRGHVETSDLRRALEDASGRDLRWIFEQWLDHGGHPDVSGVARWEPETSEVVLTLRQTQKVDDTTPLFRLPMEVRVGAGDRSHTEQVELRAAEATFRFRPGFRPDRLVVDPGEKLLKTLSVDRPPEWIRRQLREEPEASARWRAAADLVGTGHPATVDDLARALVEDPFRGVRQAAAGALGRIRSDRARDALISALPGDPHPKVRRAVAQALGEFLGDATAAEALGRAIASDPSPFVVGVACDALGRTRTDGAADVLEPCLRRPSYNSTIGRGAARGLVATRGEPAVRAVMGATAWGEPGPLRWGAAQALGETRVLDKDVREHLERLLDDADFRLRWLAADALATLGERDAIGRLQARRGVEQDSRVIRALREAVSRLGDGAAPTKEIARLEEEIEGLKARMGKLQDRMDAAARAEER